MERIKYRLSTISSLIASPRGSLAWYEGLGFTLDMIPEFQYLEKESLKIIYPFYQYGEYEEWSDSASYYLPGSSVKGALCEWCICRDNIMVDDLPIPNEFIVLRNLYKGQYLRMPGQAELKVFFKNVGVEMVKAATNLYGDLYLKEAGEMKALIKRANDVAKIKIGQMLEYLSALCERAYTKELKDALHLAQMGLESLIQDNDVILLGGYKGLLHSQEVKGFPPPDMEECGAVFLDPETGLLHGLVRIQILE